MKDEKYENEFGVESILDTNSAKMSEEEIAAEVAKPSAKKVFKSIAPLLLAILIVIGVLVGGGVISERQRQAALARECREGFQVRYNAAPEVEDDTLNGTVTEIYYSQENGLSVTLGFANGYDYDTAVTEVEMVLKTQAGKRIASAKTTLKNVVVKKGEVGYHNLYLEPHLVEINDDTLEKFTCELSLTDEKAK